LEKGFSAMQWLVPLLRSHNVEDVNHRIYDGSLFVWGMGYFY